MPNVSLTPELERFAAECVASGRYANVSEVARAALRMLREAEAERAGFLAMLAAAETEGAAQGFASGDAVRSYVRSNVRSDVVVARKSEPAVKPSGAKRSV